MKREQSWNAGRAPFLERRERGLHSSSESGAHAVSVTSSTQILKQKWGFLSLLLTRNSKTAHETKGHIFINFLLTFLVVTLQI